MEEIVNALQQILLNLNYDCIITFVDDGSNDGTLESIRQQSALYTNIFLFFIGKFWTSKMLQRQH